MPLQGGKKCVLTLGSDLEIHIPALFKEPFKVTKEDVAGYVRGSQRIKIEDQPAWKRLPVIKPVPSSQLRGGKLNLTLLFRRPVRLPRLKLGGPEALDVSGKEAREGVLVDGITLQALNDAKAAALLRGWGLTGFDSFTDAVSSLVGIEDEPVAVQEIEAERLAIATRVRRNMRLFAGWIILMPVFRLIEYHDPVNILGVVVMITMSTAFAVLFAFIYRRMRFGSSAPSAGRSHRRVIAGMAPAFAAGLAGFFALQSGCACSGAVIDLSMLGKLAAFWSPFAWIDGALAAGLGFLGIKNLSVATGALSSKGLLGKRAARIPEPL